MLVDVVCCGAADYEASFGAVIVLSPDVDASEEVEVQKISVVEEEEAVAMVGPSSFHL